MWYCTHEAIIIRHIEAPLHPPVGVMLQNIFCVDDKVLTIPALSYVYISEGWHTIRLWYSPCGSEHCTSYNVSQAELECKVLSGSSAKHNYSVSIPSTNTGL